ncbi:MAG: hypothetical protein ACE5HJ_05045 [Thermoplasmata archaeon]
MEGDTVVKLTVRERILLHLLDWPEWSERFEVPPSLTQDGIAAAAWFKSRHAAQYLRPLLRAGLVRERVTHVKGSRQRRKVYDLTDAGRTAAIRLWNALAVEVVRVHEGRVERQAALGEVFEELRGRTTHLAVLRQVVHGGVVDVAALAVPEGSPPVEMLLEAPRVEGFLGRTQELAVLTRDDTAARFCVVLGIPGIGKSWLGAKACELQRGARNLFWHRVQPWDTVATLLADVARFLAALGRPGLRAALVKGSPDQAARVFGEDLPGTHSFLVFDDAHQGGPEVVPFFCLLKDVVAQAPDVKATVLTRRRLPFYDRRDVTVDGTVVEMDLTGLGPEEAIILFPEEEVSVAAEVGRQVQGHPLFFQLVRSHPTPSRALGDLRRFMEEQIYAELTESERVMMKLASLYRVAVPRDALFFGPSLNYDILLSMTERSLIRRAGDGEFVVHDTIRAFFADLMTPTEMQELGSFAIAQLQSIARRSLTAGNPVAASGALANALELATEDRDQIILCEAFGEATEKIGDVPRALAAYRKAISLGPDAETVARLHRKSAAVFEDRGDMASARAELDAALAVLDDTYTEERGWVHVLQCVVARDVDQLEEAQHYGKEALRVFQTLGASQGEARALLELGYVEYISPDGDAPQAERYLKSALELAEGFGDPVFLSKIRIVLANVVAYEGQPEEGLAQLAAVESTPSAMSDPNLRRSYLEMKGMVNLLLDPEAAEAALTESIALARKIRDVTTEAVSEFGFGWVSLHRLRLDEARSHIEASFRKFKAQGLAGIAVDAHFYAAFCTLLQGDLEAFQAALGWLEDPELARGFRTRYPRVESLRGIDRLLEGDEMGVREAFSAALRSGRTQWAYYAHLLYGVALIAIGHEAEARDHLGRARELLRTYRWKLPLATMPVMERRLIKVLRGAVENLS